VTRTLLLYHTLGCHLCESAEQLVAPLAAERGWQVESKEISGDDALIARYGVRIPVLHDPRTGRELGWPFDAGDVLALLR